MNAAPRVLLVDNGSLEPASTLQLRAIAAALEKRLGTGRVEPVSLAHSTKIPTGELGGRPAELFEAALERCVREGVSDVTVAPLFIGPSLALTRLLPSLIAQQPALHVRVAEPLQVPGATALSTILTDLVREQLPSPATRIAIIDHGSPARAVAAARDEVAAQVRAQLGATVREVTACSMERRAGAEYDFNEPLLETLLARPEWQSGPVIIALLFIAPGRHAGPDGDVAQICRRARSDFTGVKFTRVLGQHPRLVDLLAERCGAA
ncbi:MAG: cobalamin biosynthesis protein CbiX [Verrucomicrobia bacterium]|nr:cobalamin biosynthesis protein CbiX [Verrucomicrobiota bacterium]